MNPCVWFLVLQEFGALQWSLLKHKRRLKKSDSLPLHAVDTVNTIDAYAHHTQSALTHYMWKTKVQLCGMLYMV